MSYCEWWTWTRCIRSVERRWLQSVLFRFQCLRSPAIEKQNHFMTEKWPSGNELIFGFRRWTTKAFKWPINITTSCCDFSCRWIVYSQVCWDLVGFELYGGKSRSCQWVSFDDFIVRFRNANHCFHCDRRCILWYHYCMHDYPIFIHLFIHSSIITAALN